MIRESLGLRISEGSCSIENRDERFHESYHMRGVISEFKIRSSDWIATLDPAAASPLPARGERSEAERSEGSG
jgi:hypothetical protein